MGFVGILREHLPTEPCQQVGGTSCCGAAASQPRSNGTPLGFPSAHASRTGRTGPVKRRVAAQVLDGGPRDLAGLEETDSQLAHGSMSKHHGLLGVFCKQRVLLDRPRPGLSKLLGAPVAFHEGPQDAASRGKSPRSLPGVPWGELTHGTGLQRPGPWASIENHKGFIPNDDERYPKGEQISTGCVGSTVHHVVSQRFCKKPQMPWTTRAAHLLRQTLDKTLTHELRASRYN